MRKQPSLGDLDDVNDVPKLKRLRINAVLNLCPERLADRPYDDLVARLRNNDITHLGLSAADERGFDMRKDIIPRACEFIETSLRQGGVLVNC